MNYGLFFRAFSDDRRYEKVSVSRNIHSKMSKLPFSPSVIELERGRDCASRDLGDSQTNESTDDLIYNSAYNESSSRNEEQEDNPVYSDPVEILPAYDDPAKHEEQEDNPVYYNDPATNEELEATPAYDDPGRQATPAYDDPGRQATPAYDDPGRQATPAYDDPGRHATPAYDDPGRQAPQHTMTLEDKPPQHILTPQDSRN